MSRMYVANNPSVLAAWASLGMGRDYTYSGIRIPVLDMYGEQDLPPVLKMANKREYPEATTSSTCLDFELLLSAISASRLLYRK